MAITQGAKKAYRNSQRKRVFNLRRQNQISKTMKVFKKAVNAPKKNEKDIKEAFRQVQKALDKAVKGKTIKKNTAARKKSRLSKLAKVA
jgi:small subunit ribosomal protein S20